MAGRCNSVEVGRVGVWGHHGLGAEWVQGAFALSLLFLCPPLSPISPKQTTALRVWGTGGL